MIQNNIFGKIKGENSRLAGYGGVLGQVRVLKKDIYQ